VHTATLLVPICKITCEPQTRFYGFTFHFEGHPIHHRIDTFETLELAMRWADPWSERVWEEASDADESAVLVSRRKKAGALIIKAAV
jgi:hypothetical protein